MGKVRRGGITANVYEQPIITERKVVTPRSGALGSLTSVWFVDLSPGTLRLARNYLTSWLTHPFLRAASLIGCSTSSTTKEGFGGLSPPLTDTRRDRGWWTQHPQRQPQLGTREQTRGADCPELAEIT